MKKYIVEWNAGYGASYDVVEVESYEEAEQYAYEAWREEAESQANHGITCEWSEEEAENYGVD